jgi:hypothetical protein
MENPSKLPILSNKGWEGTLGLAWKVGILRSTMAASNDFANGVSSYYQYKAGLDSETLSDAMKAFYVEMGQATMAANFAMGTCDVLDMAPLLPGALKDSRDMFSVVVNFAANNINFVYSIRASFAILQEKKDKGYISEEAFKDSYDWLMTRAILLGAVKFTVITSGLAAGAGVGLATVSTLAIINTVDPLLSGAINYFMTSDVGVVEQARSLDDIIDGSKKIGCEFDADIYRALKARTSWNAPFVNLVDFIGAGVLLDFINSKNYEDYQKGALQRLRAFGKGKTLVKPEGRLEESDFINSLKRLTQAAMNDGFGKAHILVADTQQFNLGAATTYYVSGVYEYTYNSSTLSADVSNNWWAGNYDSDNPYDLIPNSIEHGGFTDFKESAVDYREREIFIQLVESDDAGIYVVQRTSETKGEIVIDLSVVGNNTVIIQEADNVSYVDRFYGSHRITIRNLSSPGATASASSSPTPTPSPSPNPAPAKSTEGTVVEYFAGSYIRFIEEAAPGMGASIDLNTRRLVGNDNRDGAASVIGSAGNDTVTGSLDYNCYAYGGGDDNIVLSGNGNTVVAGLGAHLLMTGYQAVVLVDGDSLAGRDGLFQSPGRGNTADFTISAQGLDFFCYDSYFNVAANEGTTGQATFTGFALINGSSGNDHFRALGVDGSENDLNIIGGSGDSVYDFVDSNQIFLATGTGANIVNLSSATDVMLQTQAGSASTTTTINVGLESQLNARLAGNDNVNCTDASLSVLNLAIAGGTHTIALQGQQTFVQVDGSLASTTQINNAIDDAFTTQSIWMDQCDPNRLAASYDVASYTLSLATLDDSNHVVALVRLRGNLDADLEIAYNVGDSVEPMTSILEADNLIQALATTASSRFTTVTPSAGGSMRMMRIGDLYAI